MDEFLQALRAAGLKPKASDLSNGRLVRFRVAGDKPGSRNDWAVFHALASESPQAQKRKGAARG